MAIDLYLHADAHGLAGTFPAGEQDAQAADFTASGANTLRQMNTVPGLAMANLQATTVASVGNQAGFMGMWTTAPLEGDQVISAGGAGNLTVNIADYQSNLSANFCINRAHAYVWRPSTGAIVGHLCSYADSPTGSPTEPTAASSIQVTEFGLALAEVSALHGDVIIVGAWANITQSAATSYTVRAYYDGATANTTENAVVSDHAARLTFSDNLVFQAPQARLANQSAVFLYESNIAPQARLANQSVIFLYIPVPPPIDLAGGATDQVSASGNLSTSIDLAGNAQDQVTSTGNIISAIQLEAAPSVIQVSTSADLITSEAVRRFATITLAVKVDLDFNAQAAKDFYREVRRFAERTKPWQLAIFYETQPDEVWDLTLVSARIYGRRDEFLAVLAASGLSTMDQGLTQRRLVMPTESQLNTMKRRAGFESNPDLRDAFRPVWID